MVRVYLYVPCQALDVEYCSLSSKNIDDGVLIRYE